MRKNLFKGAATALITPFTPSGKLDLEGLEILIERQIDEGISALVLAGTTGEASTLTFEEFGQLIGSACKVIRGRIPLIAGTGNNNTAKALKWSLEAQKRGADAILSVTPYYNKTTQEGLIRHYEMIADHTELPIILYHIPSRTGMKMEAKTVKALSEHDQIIGIKEASGDLSFVADIASLCPQFPIYSGNDDQILPILSLGGCGVISVLSNISPKAVQNICRFYNEGDLNNATAVQLRVIPMIRALFSSVNPIPVKKALELMGLPAGKPRMPLMECDENVAAHLKRMLNEFGI